MDEKGFVIARQSKALEIYEKLLRTLEDDAKSAGDLKLKWMIAGAQLEVKNILTTN